MLAVLGGAVAAHSYLAEQHDQRIEALRAAYRDDAHADALQVQARVEDTFRRLYEGLRTMSRLPGVQQSIANDEPLSGDARVTLQEIYNNLASSVALSEIYVVPSDLDPDASPDSGAHTAPLTTFDELIVGKTSISTEAHEDQEQHEGEELEEIEIFEYRLMREQLAWLRAHASRVDPQRGLEVPAVLGKHVVTCDNSRFDPAHPDDEDRSGLVYTVPTYDADGELIGAMSGVVLDHALRELLPEGRFVLRCTEHDLTLESRAGDEWKSSASSVERVAADPALIYSEVLPIAVVDGTSEWKLWSGSSNAHFFAREDVLAADASQRQALWAIWIVAAGLVGMMLFSRAERRAARILGALDAIGEGRYDVEVPTHGHDALADLGRAVQRLVDRQKNSIGLMRESSIQLAQAASQFSDATRTIRGEALSSDREARDGHSSGEQMSQSIRGLATAIEQVSAAAESIAREVSETSTVARDAAKTALESSDLSARLERSSHEVSAVADMIREVSFKTNLLALNAAVEAARAGDAGRGFAVVAQEVRDLAGQVSASAKEIADRIAAIRSDANRVGSSIHSIGEIVQRIDARQSVVAKAVAEQTLAAREMSRSSASAVANAEQITASLRKIGSGTQATAHLAEDVSRSAEELDSVANRLLASCGPGDSRRPGA